MRKLFSVICGVMFAASASASDEIQSPDSPKVSHDTQVAILSFESEWPDGVKATRVHFAKRTPQLLEWLYEHGISEYALDQKERRRVALGGQPAVRVSSDVQARALVRSGTRAIGYAYQ